MNVRVKVEPQILEWACRRAGLDAAASKKQFPKLQEWKDGVTQPTFKQLQSFAQKTHVPLGILFLSEPPKETLPIKDFRTISGTSLQQPSPELLETIYICQRRQNWYHNYLLLQGLNGAQEYVGSVTLQDDIVTVSRKICDALQFDLEDRKKIKDWEETWRILIEKIEALDILVMISSVVGNNNNRKLDPEEFRGFALVDPIAPLIFINGADTKAAQMFTLAHELAHIWLGEEGLSNLQAQDLSTQEKIEKWCNQVAAELLVPRSSLQGEYQKTTDLSEEIRRLGKLYKVSPLVTLRRLYDIGTIDSQTLSENYIRELGILRKSKTTKSQGGNFYLTLRRRVSLPFLNSIVTSTLEGRTPFREAFSLLEVKPSTFDQIAQELKSN